MGGLLDLLQGAVSAGNQAKGAYVNRSVGDTESLIHYIQQARNQELARQRQATMDTANLAHLGAETAHLNRPDKPSEDERFTSRVHALQGTGLTLDDANTQAAKEMGKTPYISPIAAHEANRTFDVKHPLPPAQTNVYLPSVDPTTGQTTYSVVPHSGPVKAESTGIVRPVGGGSGQGSQAPVSDMEQRYSEIERHAKNVAAGKLKIGRAAQTREGLEYGIANQSAGGKGVPLMQSIAAGTMDMLGMGEGPEYQEYQALMNSSRAFGDDAAKVFRGRQNEDAVKREIALSELTPGDYKNPAVVEQKLSRLRHIIELARQTMPMAGNTAPTTHPVPHAAEPAPTGGRTIIVNGKKFQVPE